MTFRTRLINLIFYASEARAQNFVLNQKNQRSTDQLTRILCLLLIGFLTGNLFGTFLNTIRKYIAWDGIIVFFLVSLIEILNYNVYHNKDRAFLFFIIYPKKIKRSYWKSFQFFKIGLMLGFFIDAFKVGS